MSRLPLFVTLCLLALPARGVPERCREAADAYRSTRGELLEAVDAYGRCVSETRGEDGCEAEFSELRSAQDAFEQAVRDYADECRR